MLCRHAELSALLLVGTTGKRQPLEWHAAAALRTALRRSSLAWEDRLEQLLLGRLGRLELQELLLLLWLLGQDDAAAHAAERDRPAALAACRTGSQCHFSTCNDAALSIKQQQIV